MSLTLPPPRQGEGRFSLGRIANALRDEDEGLQTDPLMRYTVDYLRLLSNEKARLRTTVRALEIPAGTSNTTINLFTARTAQALVGVDVELDSLDEADNIVGLSVVGGPQQFGTQIDEYVLLAGFCRTVAPSFDTGVLHLHTSPRGYVAEPFFTRTPFAIRRAIATEGSDEGADVEFRARGLVRFGQSTTTNLTLHFTIARVMNDVQNLGYPDAGLPNYITS